MDSQLVLYHRTDETENELWDTSKGIVGSFTSSMVTRNIKRDEMGRFNPMSYLILSQDPNCKERLGDASKNVHQMLGCRYTNFV